MSIAEVYVYVLLFPWFIPSAYIDRILQLGLPNNLGICALPIHTNFRAIS